MYGRVFDMLFTGSMRGKGDLQLVWSYFLIHRTMDGICDTFTPQCIADATGKHVGYLEDVRANDQLRHSESGGCDAD